MNFASRPPRRTVMSYGTFDLTLPSETNHLRTLNGLGDELILGCATDAFAALHGLNTTTSYAKRRKMLEHCRYVDRVIAQETIGQIRTDIVNYNVCLFAMGEEWKGQFDDLSDIAQVIYLPRSSAPAGLRQERAMEPNSLQFAI